MKALKQSAVKAERSEPTKEGSLDSLRTAKELKSCKVGYGSKTGKKLIKNESLEKEISNFTEKQLLNRSI